MGLHAPVPSDLLGDFVAKVFNQTIFLVLLFASFNLSCLLILGYFYFSGNVDFCIPLGVFVLKTTIRSDHDVLHKSEDS